MTQRRENHEASKVSILASHRVVKFNKAIIVEKKLRLTIVLENDESSVHGENLGQPRIESVDNSLSSSRSSRNVPLVQDTIDSRSMSMGCENGVHVNVQLLKLQLTSSVSKP
jgi:hypothetical protein